MSTSITQAIVLAAGRGERMGSLTDTTPKPLLSIGRESLLYRTLTQLEQVGIEKIVVNCGYLGDQIVDACELYQRSRHTQLDIRCSIEGYPTLDTGGGIIKAWKLLTPDTTLIINADILLVMDMRTIRLPANSLAHLVLVPHATHQVHADFALCESGIISTNAPIYTFSGASILHPELNAYAPTTPRFSLLEWLRPAIAAGLVTGEVFNDIWMDIGTPERLAQAKQHLMEHS